MEYGIFIYEEKMMRKIPDFLIIGAQKSGTTSAARNLSLHPEVNVFAGTTQFGQKEIEFFNQHWEMGIDWYASHFTGEKRSNGEKTAELLHRKICHERMFITNSNFKLVVLLRSPIERAYSQWKMAALHKCDEPLDFETVVAREMALLSDENYRQEFYSCALTEKSCWREGYLLKGMYAEQIENLYAWFPKDQVFIVIAERVRRNLARSYANVFAFLGVCPFATHYAEHFIGRPGPPIKPQLRSLLADIYRQPNERLFKLLGYDVLEWE